MAAINMDVSIGAIWLQQLHKEATKGNAGNVTG